MNPIAGGVIVSLTSASRVHVTCPTGSSFVTQTHICGRRVGLPRMESRGLETITLGGGCFWCLQPVFQELRGVKKVVVGYSGGHVKNPTYEMVCTDTTGHAEVVQVTFDPKEVTLEDLLKVFFSIHDTTNLNRHGAEQ